MSTGEKNTLFVVVILIALLGVLLSCCGGMLGGFVAGASQARMVVKRTARLERITPLPRQVLPEDWMEVPPSRGPKAQTTPETGMPFVPEDLPGEAPVAEIVPQAFWDEGYEAGALLLEVTPGSPAQNGRLRKGDIIVAVDGTPLTPDRTLADVITDYEPGDKVEINVWQQGRERSATVTLEAHPENEAQAYLGVLFVPIPETKDEVEKSD